MKRILSNIILYCGIALIVFSLALVALLYINQTDSTKKMPQTTETLYSLIPETYMGFIDDRIDTSMATVEINGTDYVGIIEIPQYNTVCPVSHTWNKDNFKHQPCRYSGSIYSENFVIGGTDKHLNFSKLINIGEEICFIDMTGAKFTYSVSNISVENDLPAEFTSTEDFDFVLFIKDSYPSKYTIIYCKL